MQAATDQLRLAKDVLQARRELRERNLLPARPTEAQLKGLDASVKKNTALIRRLRTVSDGGAGLLEDIWRTNQSKACGLCLSRNYSVLSGHFFFYGKVYCKFLTYAAMWICAVRQRGSCCTCGGQLQGQGHQRCRSGICNT